MNNKRNIFYKRLKKIKLAVSYVVLILVSIYAIFPIYYIVITSLSNLPTLATVSVSSLIPTLQSIDFSNYYNLIFHRPFLTWLTNTLILTGTSTVIGVALSITSGIGLSRMHIPGKKVLLYMLLILTMFPFTIMVIPFYFMFSQLHLVNTYIGLIIPYSAGAVIFSSWLIKNYIDLLPKDYEEAAELDGYSKTEALFRILVPMAKPVIIFSALLAFMGPYTDYALAGQLITKPKLYTLAIGMYYVSQGTVSMNYSMFAAFAVLMGLPIFILFFIFQKYLVSGFSLSFYK